MFYINLFIYAIGLTFRYIISIPVNLILCVLFLSPKRRRRLKVMKGHIKYKSLMDIVNDFYQTFNYSWFLVLFTIHPVFVVMLRKGDCLNYSLFVDWIAKKKGIKERKIYQLFSRKPFMRKNHTCIKVNGDIYTPYHYSFSNTIAHFEILMNAKYYDKILDLKGLKLCKKIY